MYISMKSIYVSPMFPMIYAIKINKPGGAWASWSSRAPCLRGAFRRRQDLRISKSFCHIDEACISYIPYDCIISNSWSCCFEINICMSPKHPKISDFTGCWTECSVDDRLYLHLDGSSVVGCHWASGIHRDWNELCAPPSRASTQIWNITLWIFKI